MSHPPREPNPASTSTGRLLIRHSGPGDAAALRDLYAQPHAYDGTLQLPYPSEEQWQQRLALCNEQQRSLVAERDGCVVGQLMLTTFERHRRKHVASLSLAVSAASQRQGVASALLSAAIDLCDNWLAIRRLELTVYTDNDAAIALYRKYGFIIEGEHTDFAFRNGGYVNAYTMARVKRA